MEIQKQVKDGITIFSVIGRIAGPGGREVREVLNESIEQGARKIILDLTRVPKIDSSGLGSLVAFYISLSRKGEKPMFVIGRNTSMHNLVVMGRFHDVFGNIYTLDEAILQFKESEN